MVKLIKSVNWRVRVRNKSWWLKMIPATLLVIQVVANVFGYQPDFGDLGNKLAAVVNAVFGLIAIIGIIEDPTTEGIGDSPRARTYAYPSDANLDLTIVGNPIGDDNEEIKFDAVEDDGTYVPSDSDARI